MFDSFELMIAFVTSLFLKLMIKVLIGEGGGALLPLFRRTNHSHRIGIIRNGSNFENATWVSEKFHALPQRTQCQSAGLRRVTSETHCTILKQFHR